MENNIVAWATLKLPSIWQLKHDLFLCVAKETMDVCRLGVSLGESKESLRIWRWVVE